MSVSGFGDGAESLGEVLEEVVLQDVGDAPEQLQVDVGLAENLVDIGAGAAQLPCEPGDGASLVVQGAFDELAGVDHAVWRLFLPLSGVVS